MTLEIPNNTHQRKNRKARHLFDKLDGEFRRLAAEWEPTTIKDRKYLKADHKLTDTQFELDLKKAVAAINAVRNGLDGYWDERIIRSGRTRVVQTHPVITQLAALSDALLTLGKGYIPRGVPQDLKKLGNRLSENQASFLKSLYFSARLVEQTETHYRKAQPGRLPDCDLKEACDILAKKVWLEFKGSKIDGRQLYKLIHRHKKQID